MADRPRCDCLNFCGDDPHIAQGKVVPCSQWHAFQQARRLRENTAELLASAQALMVLIDNYHPLEGNIHMSAQAGALRQVLIKIEGKT